MGGRGRPAAARSGRVEIRCTGCGYGGVVARLPDRCPMCGERRWQRIRSTLLRSDAPPLPGIDFDHSSRAVGHL
jgi:DNA-directed RNA polymerase subunit RPC12/RpoP